MSAGVKCAKVNPKDDQAADKDEILSLHAVSESLDDVVSYFFSSILA